MSKRGRRVALSFLVENVSNYVSDCVTDSENE